MWDFELNHNFEILNSMYDQVALVDLTGTIQFVNRAWIRFALSNGGDLNSCGTGADYFKACEKVNGLALGLQSVLHGTSEVFTYEYPCHSDKEFRWFLMRVTPYEREGAIAGALICHINITERKLLELKLKEIAVKDELTSLYNRRYFEQQMKLEITKSMRNKRPLSLMLIDIDHFKTINDTWGHLAGDTVLEHFSGILSSHLRETDICARWGGDEFIVLLPETDRTQLETVAERLLGAANSSTIPAGGASIQITLSIGAAVQTSGFQAQSMFQRADNALYQAKERGRNQIYVLS